jgi:hypothetical protein
VRPEVTYLGVSYSAQQGLQGVLAANTAKGRAAMHGLITRCREMGMYSIMVQVHLFTTLVASVLDYGCTTWGVYHMHDMGSRQKQWGQATDVEELQKVFLRMVLHMPRSTSVAVMMNEAQRRPLMHAWFTQTVRWYNKIVAREHDVIRDALQDTMGTQGAGSDTCWGPSFRTMVAQVDADAADRLGLLGRVSEANLSSKLHALWEGHMWQHGLDQWGNQPHEQLRSITQSEGYKMATYRHWFSHGRVTDGEPRPCHVHQRHSFTYHVHQPDLVQSLCMFRMGAHDLNIESMRRRGVGRQNRVCQLCEAGVVEDEMHVLECPAYDDLRSQYQGVLGSRVQYPLSDDDMHRCMNPSGAQDWRRLGAFLYRVFKRRSELTEELDLISEVAMFWQ